MAIVLALVAAAFYGVSDFCGGLASRSIKPATVLAINYPVGALLMAALLPAVPGHVGGVTIAWSVGAGVFGLGGVGLLYTALARAPMHVISPITAVLSAAVPVVFGVLTGERPHVAAWVGIAIGLSAVVMISRTPEDRPHGPIPRTAIAMALVAGIAFGAYFICLGRSPDDSGLWPVVLSRVMAALLALPIAFRLGAVHLPKRPVLWLVLGSGALDAMSNFAFLIASRHGYLSIVSVITALYPAGTVALAVGVLHERMGRWQVVGLGLAAGSVALVTV